MKIILVYLQMNYLLKSAHFYNWWATSLHQISKLLRACFNQILAVINSQFCLFNQVVICFGWVTALWKWTIIPLSTDTNQKIYPSHFSGKCDPMCIINIDKNCKSDLGHPYYHYDYALLICCFWSVSILLRFLCLSVHLSAFNFWS